MSRIAIACSLLLSLTAGIASAQSFARPPAVTAEDKPATTDGVKPSATRPPDRMDLETALRARRTANLAAFHRYVEAGAYPANTFTAGEANVWRDGAGKYCAAATIIRMSGNVALVEKVAEQHNFIKLADVREGPLMDWILTSGLTQGELALIQRPFRPVGEVGVGKPTQTVRIDAAKRAAENKRLLGLYRDIEKKLAADEESLVLAVDRLMKQPILAWRVMGH